MGGRGGEGRVGGRGGEGRLGEVERGGWEVGRVMAGVRGHLKGNSSIRKTPV